MKTTNWEVARPEGAKILSMEALQKTEVFNKTNSGFAIGAIIEIAPNAAETVISRKITVKGKSVDSVQVLVAVDGTPQYVAVSRFLGHLAVLDLDDELAKKLQDPAYTTMRKAGAAATLYERVVALQGATLKCAKRLPTQYIPYGAATPRARVLTLYEDVEQ